MELLIQIEGFFMPHLIEPVMQKSISSTIRDLERAHSQVVACVHKSQTEFVGTDREWGASTKRLLVNLSCCDELIGKTEEKYVEVINILATAERTIDALIFFAGLYSQAVVQECHPSTSDDADGNDIVLIDQDGSIVARCEVCDVVSAKPGQNGKERKDLKNLGVIDEVPLDGIQRFIATSPEFAAGLLSEARVWKGKLYRYVDHSTGTEFGTRMLEIVSDKNV